MQWVVMATLAAILAGCGPGETASPAKSGAPSAPVVEESPTRGKRKPVDTTSRRELHKQRAGQTRPAS